MRKIPREGYEPKHEPTSLDDVMQGLNSLGMVQNAIRNPTAEDILLMESMKEQIRGQIKDLHGLEEIKAGLRKQKGDDAKLTLAALERADLTWLDESNDSSKTAQA